MKKKKIAILGAGKSGKACAKLALKMGYKVILSDLSNDIDFKESHNLILDLGGHSNQILDSDLIVASPGVPSHTHIIKKAIKTDIPIISEIEFASQFTDSDVLAITGSNGKSTTVTMIHQILCGANYNSFLGGNIGTPFSENVLSEIRNNNFKKSVHILELSSFQLERVYDFRSKISCILNISEDHLDRYNNMNEYIDAKLNIINVSDKTVYNSDDLILSKKIDNMKKNNLLIQHKSLYEVRNNSIYNKETKKSVLSLKQTNLIGEHNLFNILIAFTISRLYGISEKIVIKKIIDFKPLPHRLEFVRSIKGVSYYNDSKSTNIHSTITALNSFKNNVILILGGVNKGVDFFELFSSLESVNKIFCYGYSGKSILKKLKDHIDVEYIEKFEDCINQIINQAKCNENILLSPACTSFDQFSNYEERGNLFKRMVMKIK